MSTGTSGENTPNRAKNDTDAADESSQFDRGTHSRRGVLRGFGALGATLGASGLASADDDDEEDDDDGFGVDLDWDPDWDFVQPTLGDEFSLLFSNNWLVPGLDLPTLDLGWLGSVDLGNIGGAPQIERRASEIGTELAGSDYDVVAMCENFRQSERQAIQSKLSNVADVHAKPGSGDISMFDIPTLHSGLHTLTTGETNIVSRDAVAFDAQGDYVRDADFYGNKGVQYTEIDVGAGNVDLFSTHMIAGGGLPIDPEEDIPFADPDPPGLYRAKQIRQMRDFILDKQKPENLTIAAGDFNVDSANPDTVNGRDLYNLLHAELGKAGLYDAWERHGGPVGTTTLKGGQPGGLDRARIDPENPDYFESDGQRRDYPDVEDKRLDYIFVQEAQPEHSFEFDVDSIRRRHFWREKVGALLFWADKDDVPNYASDHVALELNMTVY